MEQKKQFIRLRNIFSLLQAHVVSAFEQSLSNMTQRLQQLTATAERKVINQFYYPTTAKTSFLSRALKIYVKHLRFRDIFLIYRNCNRPEKSWVINKFDLFLEAIMS